jgi:DNA-binding MarR family transcriptional regulator
MKRGLGTRLRHLLELLDGDVERAYHDTGMTDYRPRYTPIVRALEQLGPTTIKAIAEQAGITHSAVSQTLTQMRRAGLVAAEVGADARERRVNMTARLKRMLPRLHAQWQVTNETARTLDEELSHPLSELVDEAIAALTKQPFRERLRVGMANHNKSRSGNRAAVKRR